MKSTGLGHGWMMKRSPTIGLLAVPLSLLLALPPVLADLRTQFPGRRIGGGTRGECSARLLAHVVPTSSVFAPDGGGKLGVLVGPGAADTTLVMEFTPYQAKQATPRSERRLPLRGAGLYLVSVPEITQPLKWESYYKCGSNASQTPTGDDLGSFSFVGQDSPPAVSLLVAEGTAEDQKIMRGLQTYAKSCNQTVASSEIMSLLAIDSKAIIDELPQRLSVFCN